jgi:hypothetical protein
MHRRSGTIRIIAVFVMLKLNYYLQTLENNKDVFVEKA